MKIPRIIRTVGWPILSGRGAMVTITIGVALMIYAFSTVFTGNSRYSPEIFAGGFFTVITGSMSIYSLASERWYRGIWPHYELTAYAVISNVIAAILISIPAIIGLIAS